MSGIEPREAGSPDSSSAGGEGPPGRPNPPRKRKSRYSAAKRRQLRWAAILSLAIALTLTVIVVGVDWQVYHRSDRITLGGGASNVYQENLTFPWESRVTIQVDAPTGWIYTFFGNSQGIGYGWSNGVCGTLTLNESASCTLNYSGGTFVVYVEDLRCGFGPRCGPTPVNLTFSYGAL